MMMYQAPSVLRAHEDKTSELLEFSAAVIRRMNSVELLRGQLLKGS